MSAQSAFWARESAEWLAKRATMEMLLDETDAVMTMDTFRDLAEYSTSLPTGTPFCKVWKRRQPWKGEPATWWLGEFCDVGSETEVGIHWRRIHLVDA